MIDFTSYCMYTEGMYGIIVFPIPSAGFECLNRLLERFLVAFCINQ